MKYIARGFSDGLDYMRPVSTRDNRIPVLHTGFGDCITMMSNALGGSLLVRDFNPAYKEVLRMIKGPVGVDVIEDMFLYNAYQGKSYDNDSFKKESGMELSQNYVVDEYLKLDPEKFVPCSLPEEYVTVQTVGISKRARIDDPKKLEGFIKSFKLPIVDMNNLKKYGLSKAAYIIQNAKYHISIDSGTAHFALTIKNKDDVVLCLNPNRLTNVGVKWIEQDYNVEMIK